MGARCLWNFGAGPAALPAPVIDRAAAELSDWQGRGVSVMEMSHRGRDFSAIAEQAETALRALLTIPDDYRVLFLQGGATLQFAAVPLNLLPARCRAGYLHSGAWAAKAIEEACRYGDVDVIWDGAATSYTTLPAPGSFAIPEGLAYVHLTSNETIDGVQWDAFPETGAPLVADMSSDILSRPIDVASFGLLYASAQKNIGPAGLTIVIARDDLLGVARAETPTVINYRLQADAGSMLNTPSTYAIYIAGLVFEWLAELGGLETIATRNAEKAALLYAAIDDSDLYISPVERSVRSLMNAPFRLLVPELEPLFVLDAEAAGLTELKGHRSVGGVRASIYNAMPLEGVRALVAFMAEFEQLHG